LGNSYGVTKGNQIISQKVQAGRHEGLKNSKTPKWIIGNPKWSVTEKKYFFFSFFPLPFSVRKGHTHKLPLLLLSYILQNSKNPRNIGNILKNGKNRKTPNFPYWGKRGYI
jgi:hypothetical protein